MTLLPETYTLQQVTFSGILFRTTRSEESMRRNVNINRWALTAAHCVSETSLGSVIGNGDEFLVEIV